MDTVRFARGGYTWQRCLCVFLASAGSAIFVLGGTPSHQALQGKGGDKEAAVASASLPEPLAQAQSRSVSPPPGASQDWLTRRFRRRSARRSTTSPGPSTPASPVSPGLPGAQPRAGLPNVLHGQGPEGCPQEPGGMVLGMDSGCRRPKAAGPLDQRGSRGVQERSGNPHRGKHAPRAGAQVGHQQGARGGSCKPRNEHPGRGPLGRQPGSRAGR